ncbi:DNA/RNA helicase, superfamily II [Owenweeksia hongkongensis DSM 17368]|uniref:DNA/RNA helicase, superfamily II n=1 Tax=Owenweeksia hongkongensis (strain DSM 17368 / CIP 108786 / JCM 12287 / NRRL B-23963 / UST20020801) TaxID=926562 RepID=G8R4K3_OWEHD|nr:DEAD/DEAH box helicase [Owenweeksia hongkongensis]AEV32092.1 DNA/RNA helicase, superfamily II [Owenweeksia hongkongensis DSM 17368]
MSFTSLGLSSYLAKALTAQNYTKPYPIQEAAIPAILKGKDILGIAQTGSGKTASYVLPTLIKLEGKTATKNRHINVLVLVPTRELAIQVEEVFRVFGSALPFTFKSFAVFGGVSINPQMIGLQNVNVLVATPGRLLELAESNALHLSSVSTLILDEADKMLNLGFKAEMDRIFALLPKKRQNLLFSATLSPDVKNVERVLLNDPLVINIAPKEENLDLINQVGYFVNEEKKGPLLRYLIKKGDMQQVLVFTSSTARADAVADKLHHNGIPARAIHSKKSQGNRKASLEQFKASKLRVLVATDLLSRGIDIEFLPYVINYELPRSPKDFVHRIGRTGRAENPGQAVTLITPDDKHHFKVIQKKMKKAVTMIDSENLEDFK